MEAGDRCRKCRYRNNYKTLYTFVDQNLFANRDAIVKDILVSRVFFFFPWQCTKGRICDSAVVEAPFSRKLGRFDGLSDTVSYNLDLADSAARHLHQ